MMFEVTGGKGRVAVRTLREAPPTINAEALPSDERRSAAHLMMILGTLPYYEADFRHALALYDHSERESPTVPHPWKFVAGRDGAMSIFNFGKAVEGIMASVGTMPTLFGMVDRDPLRKARQLMRDMFPRFEAVRHSIAHAAELIGDPDKIDQEGISGAPYTFGSLTINPGQSVVIIRSSFVGPRLFANSFEGALQAYELSQKTANGLWEVKQTIYAAFKNAEAQTRQGSPAPNP